MIASRTIMEVRETELPGEVLLVMDCGHQETARLQPGLVPADVLGTSWACEECPSVPSSVPTEEPAGPPPGNVRAFNAGKNPESFLDEIRTRYAGQLDYVLIVVRLKDGSSYVCRAGQALPETQVYLARMANHVAERDAFEDVGPERP